MGMTMTQKILAKHAGLESVTARSADRGKRRSHAGKRYHRSGCIREMEKAGFDKVFDNTKIALVMDTCTEQGY